MNTKRIDLYVDHKRPCAYPAVEPALDFERDFDVTPDWLAYAFGIADFPGSDEGGDEGSVIPENATVQGCSVESAL